MGFGFPTACIFCGKLRALFSNTFHESFSYIRVFCDGLKKFSAKAFVCFSKI